MVGSGQLGRDREQHSQAARSIGLVNLPGTPVWVDYDVDADVLYISLRRPQRATDSQMRDDGVIVHRNGNRIVGLTILEASSR